MTAIIMNKTDLGRITTPPKSNAACGSALQIDYQYGTTPKIGVRLLFPQFQPNAAEEQVAEIGEIVA
jgi:hypothetical protein